MFGGAALLVALLVAWWMWPTAEAPKVAAQPPAPQRPVEAPVSLAMADPVEPRKEDDVLERLGIDPKVTPKCALINQWHARNVPMWVILDNMQAQAMKFDEKEIECLTASPLPPGILDTADYNTRRPVPEGLSNGPRGVEVLPLPQRMPIK